VPPALTPVSTASTTATCGNYGGWHPYTGDQLRSRYVSRERYLAAYDTLAVRLVAQRLLLDADRQSLLDQAAVEWSKALAQS
jgi:hypothetical protein